MDVHDKGSVNQKVALREESVDRNATEDEAYAAVKAVALREESVDRNFEAPASTRFHGVALREESVDRNSLLIMSI